MEGGMEVADKLSDLEDRFVVACSSAATVDEMMDCYAEFATDHGFEYIGIHHFPPLGGYDYRGKHNLKFYGVPPPMVDAWLKDYEHKRDPVISAVMKWGKPMRMSQINRLPDLADGTLPGLLAHHLEFFGEGVAMPLFGPGNRSAYCFVATGNTDCTITNAEMLRIWALASFAHADHCARIIELQRNVKLTPREQDIIELVAIGKSNADVGALLHISKNTVDTYLKRVFLKLDTGDRVTASLRAYALSFIR